MIDIIDIFAVGLILGIPVAIFVVFIWPKIKKAIQLKKISKHKFNLALVGFALMLIGFGILCFITKMNGGMFNNPFTK